MRELCVTACDMLGCHAGELTHEQILKEILYLTTDEIRPYPAYAAPIMENSRCSFHCAVGRLRAALRAGWPGPLGLRPPPLGY
jgi:hypothetical protein